MNTHKAVLLEEVTKFLKLELGGIVLDCTIGSGGQARELLKQIGPEGLLVGLDLDREALARAKEALGENSKNIVLKKVNFTRLSEILKDLKIEKVNACLFDLGVSREQLSSPERGFSFLKAGPLDMRMDQDSAPSARELVNVLSQQELTEIIKKFGQERKARRIAQTIVTARKGKPVENTVELARLVEKAIRPPGRPKRIHPATRTFQALRIAVNKELENLEIALPQAIRVLAKGGRIAVISFHSLEDRIVKGTFREASKGGLVKIITPKPCRPTPGEIANNPSARSAKLRVAEKL